MGRDQAEADADVMALWKQAEQISHLPLREIYWEGDEKAMSDTRAVQPALTVVNIALWHAVQDAVQPQGAAGHSLGEFSALVSAGVLEVKDALAITALRGALMAQADPAGQGAMAAIVKLDQQTVSDLVHDAAEESGEIIVCANYNSPLQTVVSGTRKACEIACAKAKEKKGRALPLKVSAAFHSPMMEEANKEFQPLLQKVTWHSARFPLYGNVDGLPEQDGRRLQEKMLKQMVSPVQWVKTVQQHLAAGCREWLEIGPKSILSKMVLACVDDTVHTVTTEAVTSFSLAQDYAAH